MPATISFVVPVLNDAAKLRRLLQSIAANDCAPSPVEVIVADNGSTDGSAAVAAEYGARVLDLPGLRVSALRNAAVRASCGEIIAFVDADHEIARTWAAAAARALREPGVGAAGAPYRPPRPATWVQLGYDALRSHRRDPDAMWLGSGNLGVRREVFDQVGGFDESLSTCEDVDLCRRLRSAGYRLVSDPGLESMHHGDPATLRQVFNSEWWRGRDNVAVSLRRPPDIAALRSLVISAAFLSAAGLSAAALLTGVPLLLALSSASLMALVLLRAIVMWRRADIVLTDWRRIAGIFAVGATYEAARALALVVRKGHRRAAH